MRKKVNLKRTLKILGTGTYVASPVALCVTNFRVRESQGLSKFWSLGNTAINRVTTLIAVRKVVALNENVQIDLVLRCISTSF